MLPSLSAELLLAFFMFLGAALYTSVGHAGASAYIALMALFSIPALVMRPTALVLNILVASFTSARYMHAGLFRWRTLWPFLVGALPMAFLGGYVQLPGHIYRPLVGVVLLVAAIRLLWPKEMRSNREWADPPIWLAVIAGAGVGLLSGLTGTGGGIFLSPIILFLAWSETRTASGVAAVFILFNSIAGLLGNIASVRALPPDLPFYAVAVLLGAVIGTAFGIGRLPQQGVLKALGAVLVVAGLKLVGVY
ncbi:MAG: sulfite exporter TauE/SafE family protein [Beijerinckiaceae bacterium]